MLQATRAVLRHREQWQYRGQGRPPFAIIPGDGQESVWDYPRPPRLAPDDRRVEVAYGDRRLADTVRAIRVLETASPPTFYLPVADVDMQALVENGSQSTCEWKGIAVGLDLGDGAADVAWTYPETYPEFAAIAGWIAFYPSRVDCSVASERVRPQPGGYYGGWITREVVGPFKGEPGIEGL